MADRRNIKKATYVRSADGKVIKKSAKTIGFDTDQVEFEEIAEEVIVLGCGHQADPSGWCCGCNQSLCPKCSEKICWICGRVVCLACQRNVFGHIACKKCHWKAYLIKLWREGF